ncbi:MAG: vitamin-B12 independent methionine synthase [Rubrobacteraceae bacterium]
MSSLPLLPVTTVGSWPRPRNLLRAQKLKFKEQLSEKEFNQVADEAVLEVLRLQDIAGVDIVTDGEQRRDNFFSFVAEKLNGVEMMTLAEMLDFVEDKNGFEQILQTLDVPAFSISNATCVGKVSRAKPLAVDELKFLKQHTDKPVKVPLPGPYLLTRAMYLPALSSDAYPTKEDLAEDVVRVLREEIAELIDEGADFIQFDEPVLTELVFTQGRTRTFMCAALATRKDPTEELEFAVSLINRVLENIQGVRTGLHICRGNWSQDESTLLRGSYQPLAAYLEQMNVQQLVLEYATERAGDILSFDGKELGLGVVNPRTETPDSIDAVRESIHRALQLYPAEQLFLNPDCGFGTFSNRPVNESDIAFQKVKRIVEVAKAFR